MSKAYKDAGVNIAAGYEAVAKMKQYIEATRRPEVLGGIGSFGSMFQIPVERYKQPVLVAGTDGVGTKLKLAFSLDRHDTIGIDLVAMCVNDIVVQGAEPLFFLDYIATGRLEPDKAADIVKGIASGCQEAGCALIGGETAEMPDFYAAGEYDVAGFAVGCVEREALIDGSTLVPGDVLFGLPASGLHSNGYSLVRKLIPEAEWDQPYNGTTMGEELLRPTRIYVAQILTLLQQVQVKGMAHITGGGFYENIPRMFGANLGAVIDTTSWPVPPIFSELMRRGQIPWNDMFNTFNMGIGMVMAVSPGEQQAVAAVFSALQQPVHCIGQVTDTPGLELVGV